MRKKSNKHPIHFIALVTVILTLSGINITRAQGVQDSTDITPYGYLDTVLDNFGNRYPLTDFIVNDTLRAKFSTSSTTVQPLVSQVCGGSYFELYYENGWEGSTVNEAARKLVLCRVMEDLSNFIVSPLPSNEKVRIWVRHHSNMPSPVSFAAATPLYNAPYNTAISGIIDNVMWTTIVSGKDAYTNVAPPVYTTTGSSSGGTFFHGVISINFDDNDFIHTLLSPTFTSTQFDLYTTVLHEMLHALGFNSLIKSNGTSQLGNGFSYYTRYDTKLQTQSAVKLITNSGSCSMYNWAFTASTSVLQPNPFSSNIETPICNSVIEYSGSTTNLVYTPNTWVDGSSLSHFEDACPPISMNNLYYVMSNSSFGGSSSMNRHPTPEERKALCDLGYAVDDEFGDNSTASNSHATYTGGNCNGIQVAGINDGLTQGMYDYTTTMNGSYTWTTAQFLTNDYNATSGFECLEDISGGTVGTFNITAGTAGSSVVYTPPTSVTGVRLLRYVPVNGSNKGNITYIYVYIGSADCEPTVCTMINNGGFENSTSCYDLVNTASVDCWNVAVQSPDLFSSGCFTPWHNVPCSTYFTSTVINPRPFTTTSNNTSWLGFGYANGNLAREAVQTKLGYPISNNNTYRISFWARLADMYSTTPLTSPAQIAVGATANSFPMSPMFLPTSYVNLIPNGITIPNDGHWHYITQDFYYTGSNLNNLVIANSPCEVFNNCSIGTSYIMIDDVALTLANICAFTPPSVMLGCETISDLADHVTIPGGVFSGPGVSFSGGVYSFSAVTAGTGLHTIEYSYTDNNDCDQIIYAQINVLSTCDPCTQFSSIEYTIIGGSNLGLGTINADITSGDYYIHNDIIITGDRTFTNANILIAPNVTIYVSPTSKLTLESCHLYSCTDMWKGIELQTNGTTTGALELKSTGSFISGTKGTLIEDAKVAVKIPNDKSPASGLGTTLLRSNNSCFNRNTVAVDYSNATTSNAGTRIDIQNTIFTSRKFSEYEEGSLDYPLIWPSNLILKTQDLSGTAFEPAVQLYHDFAKINCKNGLMANIGFKLTSIALSLTSYNDVQIGTFGIGSGEETNYFDNMQFGIRAEASNFSSVNNVFMDIAASGGIGGSAIYATPLNDITYNTTPNRMRVYRPGGTGTDVGNWFYNCARGVEAFGYKEVLGERSDIRSKPAIGFYGYKIQSRIFDAIKINNNYIYNMRVGIYANAATPNFLLGAMEANNNLIGIVGSLPYQFVDRAIHLERVGGGISPNPNVTGSVTASYNRISGVYNGIYLNGFKQKVSYCSSNTISLVLAPITYGEQHGINHNNCMNFHTLSNTVTGFGYGAGKLRGIGAYGSSSINIACNNVNECNFGFEFKGASSTTHWRHNTMTNNKLSFALNGLSAAIGHQYAPGMPSENHWTTAGSFTYNALAGRPQTITMNKANPASSVLYVLSNTSQNPTENGYSPYAIPQTTFPYSSSTVLTTNQAWSYYCPDKPVKKGPAHLMGQMITNNMRYDDNNMRRTWIAQNELWQNTLADTTLLDSFALLQEFRDNAWHGRFAMLRAIDSVLADDDTSLVRSLINDSALLYPKYDSSSNGVVIADDSTVNPVIDNYRKFYDAYLKYLGGTMNADDSSRVDSLARLCPTIDGYVVFGARSFYHLLYDDFPSYEEACEDEIIEDEDTSSRPGIDLFGVQPFTMVATNGAQGYTLLPNPNNGNFSISQLVADEQPVSAEIWNAVGMRMYKNKIQFKGKKAQVLLGNIMTGNYLLKMTDSNGSTYIIKFTVL